MPERRSCRQNDALIMDTLMQANGPLSAYDIARVASRSGRRIMPNQVYRTLTRLIDQGRVVRIDMLGAYLPRPSSGDLCLICAGCRSVVFVKAPRLLAAVARVSAAHHFTLVKGLVETRGQCGHCG